MKEDITRVQSISELHDINGLDKPTHPLISIIDVSKWEIKKEWVGMKMASNLYSIALKDKSCAMDYGRNTYDFNEGVMIFTAPNQVLSVQKEQKLGEINGWMMFFHPELIRNTPLGSKMDSYQFFSYDVHEALHLSDAEQQIMNDCLNLIKNEIAERIDDHSQTVISSTLELILNYSRRFYERQFNTRSAQNNDLLSKFQSLLQDYYNKGELKENGIPSINYFSDKIFLSPNYLSDLMKKETGKSAKDHINDFVIEKAKTLLLSSNDSIGELSFTLGFNYPHYFSRLFKSKTGITPQEYRQLN